MTGEASKQISTAELWGGGRSPFSISYGKMYMWFFLISDALTFSGLLVSLGVMRHKYSDVWPDSSHVFHAFPFTGPDTNLPLLYVALMTFILIVSSVTMVLAVEAGHRMDKKGVTKWLALTIVGGLFFLLSQVWEWSHFIHGTEHGVWEWMDGTRANLVDGAGNLVAKWGDGITLTFLDGRESLTGAAAAAMLESATQVYGANLHVNEYGHQLYADFFFFVTGFHGFHVFSGVVINFIILIGVMKGIYHKRGHYEMVEKTGLYWHFVDLVWVFVFTIYYLL
ncbi:MAG TPA: cytochrome oxidase subunit III [Flavobacteriales bacterium]|jgi:cytochrome c oxidase subunit 3|nr:cytochrome oxidase subunit III [Flavobacteriales bacterium]HIO68741.1 cytochrome oxidase subunit III [Flavobacteriales bacterium]